MAGVLSLGSVNGVMWFMTTLKLYIIIREYVNLYTFLGKNSTTLSRFSEGLMNLENVKNHLLGPSLR